MILKSYFQTYLVVYTSLNEVLRLSKRVCGVNDRKTINLCWTIIAVFEYYLVGPSCLSTLLSILDKDGSGNFKLLKLFIKHHEAIVFSVYLCCLVVFVLTMTRTNYLRRYMFASSFEPVKLKIC
jgi:hypothetical protein